jgi:hypothetical protein
MCGCEKVHIFLSKHKQIFDRVKTFEDMFKKMECLANMFTLNTLGILSIFKDPTFYIHLAFALALDFITARSALYLPLTNVAELHAGLSASNHAPLSSEFDNLNQYLDNPSQTFPLCVDIDDFGRHQSNFISLINQHGPNESSEIFCTVRPIFFLLLFFIFSVLSCMS